MKKTVSTRSVAGNAKAPRSADSLPPLKGGRGPQTFDEMWAGYDPRKDPLETEILKECEEDGVALRVVRFRIGIFKGRKAMMAAIYGFPKGAKKCPGLVQIHGGGQYADYMAVLTNAKRGYATVSLAWAGRINWPPYTVGPDGVALFWAGKTDDPNYRITTDWGPLDGYHAPCRNEKNDYGSVAPAPWTLDAVDSPRNNNWFLDALGARRALTFLEQQPEVDPGKLGVYGHSMGGKLTVMTTAADSRVRAAAPSCGGISDRAFDKPQYNATIGDAANLRHISCPIIFLSPSNDFHGRINDLQKAIGEITSRDWRMTCAAHHNHQDTEAFQVAGPLWFDQYLKGTFKYPKTPDASLLLKTRSSVPRFTVTPDASTKIISVDIFYTQQGQRAGEANDLENTQARFWHHAKATRRGNTWSADLPVLDTDRPLWAYANVLYPLKTPVTAAGYYYAPYTARQFNLSSRPMIAEPEQLKAAGVKATDKPSLVIETFEPGWEKEWFTYDLTGNWARCTHKVYDPKWRAPAAAELAIDVRCKLPMTLVVWMDNYSAEVPLKGGGKWQSVTLTPASFHNTAGVAPGGWNGVKELRLTGKEAFDAAKPKPEFRKLRWVKKSRGRSGSSTAAR